MQALVQASCGRRAGVGADPKAHKSQRWQLFHATGAVAVADAGATGAISRFQWVHQVHSGAGGILVVAAVCSRGVGGPNHPTTCHPAPKVLVP